MCVCVFSLLFIFWGFSTFCNGMVESVLSLLSREFRGLADRGGAGWMVDAGPVQMWSSFLSLPPLLNILLICVGHLLSNVCVWETLSKLNSVDLA